MNNEFINQRNWACNMTAGILANYYDLLATTTNHPHEKLQAEIKRQLGLAGRREIIGTNELMVDKMK